MNEDGTFDLPEQPDRARCTRCGVLVIAGDRHICLQDPRDAEIADLRRRLGEIERIAKHDLPWTSPGTHLLHLKEILAWCKHEALEGGK